MDADVLLDLLDLVVHRSVARSLEHTARLAADLDLRYVLERLVQVMVHLVDVHYCDLSEWDQFLT